MGAAESLLMGPDAASGFFKLQCLFWFNFDQKK
jgi:hypothetical protein